MLRITTRRLAAVVQTPIRSYYGRISARVAPFGGTSGMCQLEMSNESIAFIARMSMVCVMPDIPRDHFRTGDPEAPDPSGACPPSR
jgi:hypothetical protein